MKILILISAVFIFSIVPVKAQFFTDISSQLNTQANNEHIFIIGGGVVILDYDNDGWEDFFLPSGFDTCKLYKNNGDGTFTDVFLSAFSNMVDSLSHVFITTAIAGDIDNDGDKDIFLGGAGNKQLNSYPINQIFLFENNGNGTFKYISNTAGFFKKSYTETMTLGDFNKDGFLDLYVGNYFKSMSYGYDSLGNQNSYIPECYDNFFYVNNKNNTFTEVSQQYYLNDSGCALASIFSDFDFDSDVDLFIANDFGEWHNYPNVLMENNFPADNFSKISNATGFNRRMYGMGIAPGDYDNDGDLDYYVTNIGRNSLYRNNGDKTFTDVASDLGVDLTWQKKDSVLNTSWGCNFFDFDNDGDEDLYVNAGYVESFFPPTAILDTAVLFLNNGDGTFTNISSSSGFSDPIAKRGSVIFDYDKDGDLDLITNHTRMQIFNNYGGIPQYTHLYRNNNLNSNNWIEVKLTGIQNNKDGFGCRIVVYENNKKWIREISGGDSHASQSSSIAHFGLGDNVEIIDSLKVYWLNKKNQTIYSIPVNQLINVNEVSGLITNVQINNRTDPVLRNKSSIVSNLSEIELYSSKPVITDMHISIVNFLGEIVCESDIIADEHKNIIPFKNQKQYMSDGLYFLVIDSDDIKISFKIFIKND